MRAAARPPNIGRNLHDFVTWKATKGGSLLCKASLPCIEFWLADRNQSAHHSLIKACRRTRPCKKSAVKNDGSNLDNPNIRVVAGARCDGGRGAFG
jgi:hypothetical protein